MIVARIVGAAMFVGAIGCAIASSIVLSDMVEDINQASAAREQENPMGWHFGKVRRVQQKYRMLYPEGSRSRKHSWLLIAALVLAVVGARLMLAPNLFGF